MSPIYDVWYNTNYFIINAKPRKEFMKMLTNWSNNQGKPQNIKRKK